MTAEDFLRAAALGVVEGLTEFLPISSTAHLIVANHFLGGEGEGAKVFEVAIQLGAILAVAWEYRRRLFEAAFHPAHERSRRLLVNLFVAFLPAAILGVMLHGFIKEHLFDPRPAAFALAAGGAFLIWIEKKPRTATIEAVDSVGNQNRVLDRRGAIAGVVSGRVAGGGDDCGGAFVRLVAAGGDGVFVFAGAADDVRSGSF